jgi:hypothetical protein
MKTTPAILVALYGLCLAGCVLHEKPKPVLPPTPVPVVTPPPAPPPQPLSMPQTEVHLPPLQPVDEDALSRPTAPEAPVGTPPPRTPTRNRTPRQAAPPAVVEPPAAAPPPVTEPERAPVQEVLAPAERTRLKNSADVHRREIRNWLNTKGRRMPANDPTVARIHGLLQASDEAEKNGDIRGAADWADRALLLMRELQK